MTTRVRTMALPEVEETKSVAVQRIFLAQAAHLLKNPEKAPFCIRQANRRES